MIVALGVCLARYPSSASRFITLVRITQLMPTIPPPIAISELNCPLVSAKELIESYEVLLLDAYGVLVHSSAALPGAAEFIDAIGHAEREFYVVTNDASKLPETLASTLVSYGLDVRVDQIISSGMLLKPFFATVALEGARCMVLGPEDSFEYVRQAGGEPVPPSIGLEFDALIVCDDTGYPFLETMDLILSLVCQAYDAGREPMLILPNPDLIYPKSENSFAFTSGTAALMLEAALGQRYPQRKPSFTRLGKPFGPIFREVRRRVGDKTMIMIGDQIDSDIIGARAANIDAALARSGIAKWEEILVDPARAPTFRLRSIAEGLE